VTEPVEGAPVFRDRRRIDPQTFEVREPAPDAAPGPEVGAGGGPGDIPPPPEPSDEPAGAGPDSALLDAELAELTSDLQRLSAEYANYRRRVERDRDVVRETAVAAALAELLPILDDVGRARQHGELDGAFRAVGEALEAAVARLGLEAFAGVGEPFDPVVHEALTAVPVDEPGEPLVLEVFQPGYRFAGRVVRPARVVVTQPATADPPEGGATA
jgi:molecular chaperone GrpE